MNKTPSEQLEPFGEKQLIETVFQPLTEGIEPALALKDDCACLRFDRDQDIIVTKDALVSGIHFFADDSPADIGWKSLAVNLSDLAAKGARPHSYMLAIAIPKDISLHWLMDFAAGLKDMQDSSGCQLIGGDTVFTPGPLTISISAFGVGPLGEFVPRHGAKPGDLVYVSGTIGDSALGLQLRREMGVMQSIGISEADKGYLGRRYLRPIPRLNLSPSLRSFASAAMDISDGLLGDFRTLCKASGVSGKLFFEDVPLSSAARNVLDHSKDPKLGFEIIDIIVGGGDDYEILAIVPPESRVKFEKGASEAGVEVTKIGHIEQGTENQVLMLEQGRPVHPKTESYLHF